MEKVILSLGSSIGDKQKTLSSAVIQIERKIGRIISKSEIYESAPWGFADANNFYNLALSLETTLSPTEVLKKINIIEKNHGRERKKNTYTARTLDIDIIFFGSLIISTKKLIIPHKFAHQRLFVLLPISEFDNNFVHPKLKKTIFELIKECKDDTKTVRINSF